MNEEEVAEFYSPLTWIRYYLFDKWRKDKCQNCKGSRGGVKGNENIVDGKVLCDYCTSDTIKINH